MAEVANPLEVGPRTVQWAEINGRQYHVVGGRVSHAVVNPTFDPIAKAAGLTGDRRPTPHWLRHSHVFVCHAAGMSLPEIQRRIGHEDIKMTINTYGRLIDDMSDDVAARLDLLLTPDALPAVVAGEVVG